MIRNTLFPGVAFAMLVCAFPTFAAGQLPSVYTRSISPFPVLNQSGQAYTSPFLGGFNVPRPQLVDIDADGDLDLFLQEKTGQLRFYEQIGEQGGSTFTWKSDFYQELDIGQWYRFADLDSDGDYDLMAEEPFNFIRFYENKGSPQEPRFHLAADSLRDTDGAPIFSDRQNIPNVADIDCDQNPDLFLGRLDGTITHYEREGTGVPTFVFRQDRFEDIEIVGSIGKTFHAEREHGANTLAFVDIDADGDEDIFWGDFFEAGLLFLENTGSCADPVIADPVIFPANDPVLSSGYNAPTFGDVDGDGQLDFIVGVLGGAFSAASSSANNLLYFTGNEAGDFDRRSGRALSNIDVGSDSFPVLIDWDDDGDLDLVVSNSIDPSTQVSSSIVLFRNTGNAEQPVFVESEYIELGPFFNSTPAFGDLDGDSDLDLLVGSWQGPISFYRNVGTRELPVYELAEEAFLPWPRGSNSTPTLIDFDEDGDLDAVVGEAVGTLSYYQNIGSESEPEFALVSENFGGIDAGRRSVPLFIDLDANGEKELVVGSDQDGIQVYRNTGSVENPQFELFPFFDLPDEKRAVPALGDLDDDGDLDIVLGLLEGGLLYFENQEVLSGTKRPVRESVAAGVSVYPNPFSSASTLTVESEMFGPFELEIFDVLGKRTGLSYSGFFTGSTYVQELDFSALPAGIYFGRFVMEAGSFRTIQFLHTR